MSDFLTVLKFREHVTTSLDDTALADFIDAEEEALLAKIGPLGAVTDVRFPRGDRVFLLGRIPASVTSVTERRWTQDYVLTPDDYVLDRSTLRRLATGPNPWDGYVDRITIVYTPQDDSARRLIALIKLVALDVKEKDASAVKSRTVGLHTVAYDTPTDRAESRRLIWEELENASAQLLA